MSYSRNPINIGFIRLDTYGNFCAIFIPREVTIVTSVCFPANQDLSERKSILKGKAYTERKNLPLF